MSSFRTMLPTRQDTHSVDSFRTSHNSTRPFFRFSADICRNRNNGFCSATPCPRSSEHTCGKCGKEGHTYIQHESEREKNPFTLVNVQRLRKVLACYSDITEAKYLVSGFTNKFSIGYRGPRQERSTPNALTARSNPDAVKKSIAKSLVSSFAWVTLRKSDWLVL